MQFPQELEYSKDHEWIRFNGHHARLGITEFAQGELGDIVYVDIPETGKEVQAGEVFGSIEAVKTVSDLFMPLAGTILQVNPLLKDNPELINTDPYGEGWIIEITPTSLTEPGNLMDAEAYRKLVG
jgi:glycine cleavage system H protein